MAHAEKQGGKQETDAPVNREPPSHEPFRRPDLVPELCMFSQTPPEHDLALVYGGRAASPAEIAATEARRPP